MFTPTYLRRISQLVIITFTSLTLQPLQAAVMAERQNKAAIAASQGNAVAQTPAPQSKDEQYSQLLEDIKTTARQAATTNAAAQKTSARKGKRQKGKRQQKAQTQSQKQAIRDDAQALRGYARQLEALEPEVETEFAATEQHLRDHNLPAVILARQQAAVAEYKAKQAEFKNKLKALEDADDKNDDRGRATAMDDMAAWLEKNQKSKTHEKTDPNNLPFSKPSGKVRAPKKTHREYLATLFKQKPVMLAGPIPNGFTLPSSTLPATPTAADLAPTEDIVLTPAIKALAASLNNNPVQIYNWVRNNIEYLPTYGSIQGADMTLQTKKGNSFDTASLLIGLFRAAGIPARYVYGTIQVPADQAMNWVGGVTKPEAAQQIMGQGGIPNIGLAAGGVIKAIELEHVWVEAYVDYTPSRGAINKHPDTWVPMDASFKQYAYTQGMDIKTAVPFDVQGITSQAQVGATISPSGWLQNVNASAVMGALTTYQAQLKNYISTTKPNATVGDVIGAKTIIPKNHPILMGTLPYPIVAEGGKFSALPAMVRHQFQYNLYASAMDRAMGNAAISYQQSLPNIAGKKITLSFTPASQADANLIASYPLSSNSLPAYLIHLNAELKVDGQAVAVAGPFTMGDTLVGSEGLYDPATGWSFADDTSPTAGEYIATHVDLQGVSRGQIQALQNKLAQTQAKLTTNQLTGLTKEDVGGDILYNALLTYFVINQSASQFSQRLLGVVEYRKPSFGNFYTASKTLYWFGIATSISFPGVTMDINRYASMNVAKDNNPVTAINYNKQSGMRASALEHLVPEKLFASPTDPNPPKGMSAMRALALAASQGQKIFALNATNQASLLAQINIDPQAMAEIQNALAAGKEVTVHQSPITQSGWTGSGYIITDPATGAGAYKLVGGANGGWVATKYVLQTLNIFFDFINSLAAYLGPAIEKLAGSVRIIQFAKFIYDIFDKSMTCSNVGAVIIVMTELTILSILVVELMTMLVNPLVGFVVGILMDQAIDWLMDQSSDCAPA